MPRKIVENRWDLVWDDQKVPTRYPFPTAPYIGYAAREDREESTILTTGHEVLATVQRTDDNPFLLPLNFATALFSPSSLANLISAAAYVDLGQKPALPSDISFNDSRGNEHRGVLLGPTPRQPIRLSPFVLTAVDDRMSPEKLAWDAGVYVDFKYRGRGIRLAGPAYVSFDHALSRCVGKEGSRFGLDHFIMIVQAHLATISDRYDVMAVGMKNLPAGSLTRGLFVDAGFKEYRFTESEENEGKSFLVGQGKRESFADKPFANKEYERLVEDDAFWRLVLSLSLAWDQNFVEARKQPQSPKILNQREKRILKIANQIADTP